jgi:hypothetical protein
MKHSLTIFPTIILDFHATTQLLTTIIIIIIG